MATDVVVIRYSVRRGALIGQGTLLIDRGDPSKFRGDPVISDEVLLHDGVGVDIKRLDLAKISDIVRGTLVHLNAGPGD